MVSRAMFSSQKETEYSLTKLQAERDAIGAEYWTTQISIAGGKIVLLVEGETDRTCIETALESYAVEWSKHVFVIAVGGRTKVLEVLKTGTLFGELKLPQPPARIFGLIDRDVWTDQDVQDQQTRIPNLHVTEGWCLENSLLLNQHGQVLSALEPVEFSEWADGYTLAWAIQNTIDAYPIKSGKLYGPVRPLRVDWTNHEQIVSIVQPLIPAGAQQLADALLPSTVVASAASRRRTLGASGREEVVLKAIHGKYFLKANPVRALLRKYGSDTDKIRLRLAPNLLRRPFMRALLQALGVTSP